MLFKRHWKMIRDNQIAVITCYIIVFQVMVYMIYLHSLTVAALCALVIPLSLLGTYMLSKTYDGFFDDQIVIDATGISLLSKVCESKRFRWEEIKTIQRSKYNRYDILIVTSQRNDRIWFYSSERILHEMEETSPFFAQVYDPDHTIVLEGIHLR